MNTFSVLASEDFESKQAQSRAMTAAIVRAQEMFDPYLSRASSAEDKADRILLIEDDLKRVAYAVSKEYGYSDHRHLYEAARAVLAEDKADEEDEEIKEEWEKPWEKKEAAGASPETGDSYQSERVDLPSNKDTGLGGPSPKIDKGSAGDEAGSSQKPIDIGSKRNQHELQNATDRADYTNEDFDPSSPVRERVDADKPMQPEFTKAPATDTWSGTEGQANPVTSKYQLVELG